MDSHEAIVFLGSEDARHEADLPYYPIAKLGDWGFAQQTWSNDPANPDLYQNAGTTGYMAPVSQYGLTAFAVSTDSKPPRRSI